MRRCLAVGSRGFSTTTTVGNLKRNYDAASRLSAAIEKGRWDISNTHVNGVGGDLSATTTGGASRAHIDPMDVVADELTAVCEQMKAMVENTRLNYVAQYYFLTPSKLFRPSVSLLVNQLFGEPNDKAVRLAGILECIHTASLVHDDVIDNSDQRRGTESINAKYGNKVAILVGDFLLAKASVALASLKNHEVTRLLSQVIAELVEGELMQLTADETSRMDHYLRKTYLKTGSLICNGARCSAILAGASEAHIEAVTLYGENLGMAFQVVDDILDLTATAKQLGKPAQTDLKLGISTAPILFAAQTHPELNDMMDRKFSVEGDERRALQLVHESNGVQQAQKMAQDYAEKSISALECLPESPAKDALYSLASRVITRKH